MAQDQQKYTNKLANARALVIGGTSGIGFAVAEMLVEYGAIVTVSSSNPDKIAKTVSGLKKSYPSKEANISGKACDLSDGSTLEANIKQLLDTVTDNNENKIDHIVHTAGDALQMRSLADLTTEFMDKGGMVRYYSVLFLAKHAPEYMSPGPVSSITLTTGSISQRPIAGTATAAGRAAGLHGLMRGLALDLKPIRVNLISPGAVETELWDTVPKEFLEKFKKDAEGKMPTGRWGRPEDVAETYLAAIRDYNCTGSVLSSNGGALLVG